VTARSVAIIGAGPTGIALLERLLANAVEAAFPDEVHVHLIDPFPTGAGRIWRRDQTDLLWMNSMAEDVTMFTDASVTCEGPIVPGPSLDEWAREVDLEGIGDPGLVRELRELTATSFPTRLVQSEYLRWVRQRLLDGCPAHVRIIEHASAAIDLVDDIDRQRVHLASGEVLVVDVAVLAVGHLDAEPTGEYAALQTFAEEHNLLYFAPAQTTELDLDQLTAGEPVIVRGFGLAFIDLMVLVTIGRGGRFIEDGGSLRYEASGAEPILHVGSRRGVPYHCKPGYRLLAPRAPLPRFFNDEAVERLVREYGELEFWLHLWPLLAKDIAWAYYAELFRAHPERVLRTWEEFDALYAECTWGSPELSRLIELAVPDSEDHFDVVRIDDPVANERFASRETAEAYIARVIEDDRRRRTNDEYSADLGAFYALLIGFGQLVRVLSTRNVSVRSTVEDIQGWWYSFFSDFASGPPPARLDQLLALHRAGIVRFLGPRTWIATDAEQGLFRAGSAKWDGSVESRALVDARIPAPHVERSVDLLISALRRRGSITSQRLEGNDGYRVETGKLVVDAGLHVVNSDGAAHPRRFALGTATSRPAAGTFARPRTNALSFRQNDQVARAILDVIGVDLARANLAEAG
jgi:FAD-NAD(P)-binding protein